MIRRFEDGKRIVVNCVWNGVKKSKGWDIPVFAALDCSMIFCMWCSI